MGVDEVARPRRDVVRRRCRRAARARARRARARRPPPAPAPRSRRPAFAAPARSPRGQAEAGADHRRRQQHHPCHVPPPVHGHHAEPREEQHVGDEPAGLLRSLPPRTADQAARATSAAPNRSSAQKMAYSRRVRRRPPLLYLAQQLDAADQPEGIGQHAGPERRDHRGQQARHADAEHGPEAGAGRLPRQQAREGPPAGAARMPDHLPDAVRAQQQEPGHEGRVQVGPQQHQGRQQREPPAAAPEPVPRAAAAAPPAARTGPPTAACRRTLRRAGTRRGTAAPARGPATAGRPPA